MRTLVSDLRYAVRTLCKAPGFTLVAVLTLALGIGANTTIFSVVNSVLLEPLRYSEPGQLVVIWESSRQFGGAVPTAGATFLDWRNQSRSFSEMSAAEAWGVTLNGAGEPEQLKAVRTSANLFALLGTQPALGRTFLGTEDQPANEHAVVLSQGLWQRRFGADRSIIGRQLQLSGEKYTVVGVMPPSFEFPPFWATGAEIWAPLPMTPDRMASRGGRSLRVFARLKPGVTLPQAQAEMDGIGRQIATQYPESNAGVGVKLEPLRDRVVGNVRPALLALMGAVGLVLLIACANLANLHLVRGAARQRELAVRAALGAGRSSLFRLALLESLILSVAGGATGCLLASWGVEALSHVFSAAGAFQVPRAAEIAVEPRVLLFAIVLSLTTGALFGIVPALRAAHSDPADALKESERGSAGGAKGSRIRNTLVVAEVALALMLLSGAGLLIRTFVELQQIDPGFQPDHVLTAQVPIAGTAHAGGKTQAAFYQQVTESAAAMPGVVSAAVVNHLPLAGDVWTLDLSVEGRPDPLPGERGVTGVYRVISPGYFRTIRASLLQGRDFTSSDAEGGTPVAIINAAMARQTWPDGDPIGKRIRIRASDREFPWATIVGVVANIKQNSWEKRPEPEFYLPYLQYGSLLDLRGFTASMAVVMRTARDPAGLTPALRSAVSTLDPAVPLADVLTLESAVNEQVWKPRFWMMLFGGFAGFALLLAAVGIFGVVSYTVTQRNREIGIRLALGATRRQVVQGVVGGGLSLALLGIAIGLAAALAVSRLMQSLLYGITPTDVVTYAGVVVLLVLTTAAACYLPARRASRVDPMVALRYE